MSAGGGWRITRLSGRALVPAAVLLAATAGCAAGRPPTGSATPAGPVVAEAPRPSGSGAPAAGPSDSTRPGVGEGGSTSPGPTANVESTPPDTTSPSSTAAPSTSPATTATPTTAAEPSPPSASTSPPRRSDVRVTDGDTFEIVLGGVVERVRLVGVNAPESGECLADLATEVLDELLATAAALELAPDVSDRDQYGRLLRHVTADGVWVNAELVRRGVALSRAYPPDTTRQDALDDAQTEAQRDGVGMWNPAACGTASTAELAVSAIAADPPGDDTDVLLDEWVEITNIGAAPVDFTGWGLKDESARNRYSFPARYVLAPGAAVRVRSGCGADTATDLHWCAQGSAIWNNAGDTVYVLDPQGNIVVSRSYDG